MRVLSLRALLLVLPLWLAACASPTLPEDGCDETPELCETGHPTTGS